MPPLYLDEDVNARLASALRGRNLDVSTIQGAGRRSSGDEEQLIFAARMNRVLDTSNGRDYTLLQRAWRYWGDLWSVTRRPAHAGNLVEPQNPPGGIDRLARDIGRFLRSGAPIANRLHELRSGRGWVAEG